MKVHIISFVYGQIPCLVKIQLLELSAKMLKANQIVGFFKKKFKNLSQEKIDESIWFLAHVSIDSRNIKDGL